MPWSRVPNMTDSILSSLSQASQPRVTKPIHWGGASEVNSIFKEQRGFLSDPSKIERVVSHLTRAYLPEKIKQKVGYVTNLEKIEKGLPSDDPRKNFGSAVMGEAEQAILANPDKHPVETIARLFKQREKEIAPSVYKYLDTARKGWLPFGLSDKEVGKELGAHPGYEQYRQQKEAYNKKNFNTEDFMSPTNAAMWGALPAAASHFLQPAAEKAGAGLATRAAAALARGLGGTMMKGISNPILKVAATGLAMIPTIWAGEAATQLAEKNPIMEDQNPWVKSGVGFVAGGVGMHYGSKLTGMITSKFLPGLTKAKAGVDKLVEEAAANPEAEKILELASASKRYEGQAGNFIKTINDFTTSGETLFATPKGWKKPSAPGSEVEGAGGVSPFGELGSAATKALRPVPPGEIVGESFVPNPATPLPSRTGLAVRSNPLVPTGKAGLPVVQDISTRIQLGESVDQAISEATRKAEALKNFESIKPWEPVNPAGRRIEELTPSVGARDKLIGPEYQPSSTSTVSSTPSTPSSIPSAAVKKIMEPTENLRASIETAVSKNLTTSRPSNIIDSVKAKVAIPVDELITREGKIAKLPKEELIDEVKIAERQKFVDDWKEAEVTNKLYDMGYHPGITKIVEDTVYKPTRIMDDLFKPVSDEEFQAAMKAIEEGTKGAGTGVTKVGEDFWGSEYIKKAEAITKKFEAGKLNSQQYSDELMKLIDEEASASTKAEVVKAKGSKQKGNQAEKITNPIETVEPEVDFKSAAQKIHTDYLNKHLTDEQRDSLMDELVSKWAEKSKESKGALRLAATVAGAGTLLSLGSLLSPSEAEASPIKGLFTNFAREQLETAGIKAKDIIKKLVESGQYVADLPEGAKEIGQVGHGLSTPPSLNNLRTSRIPFQDIWSPNVVQDFLFTGRSEDGRKLFVGPMQEIASRTSIAMANAAKGIQVVKNVMKDVLGGESHWSDVREAMKPILPQWTATVKYSAYKGNVEQMEKAIANIERKAERLTGIEKEQYLQTSEIYKAKMAESIGEIEKLKDSALQFEANWRKAVEPLAQQFPSTRIALALEGHGMSAADPWVLKYMSEGEKEAVGYLKKLHDTIGGLIEGVGGKIIKSQGYVHHASHPDMDWNGIIKDLTPAFMDTKAIIPLAKLHSRSFGSLQMMPDIHFVMQQYLPDIFRRVEMMDFWKKGKPNGWEAFSRAVTKEGWRGPSDFMKSIERSFAPEDISTLNDIARKAYAFEAARLIGLNPAPGFKHLMKLTANLANFGPIEWTKTLPEAFNLYRKDMIAMTRQKLGLAPNRDIETELYHTMTNAGHMSAMIQDLALHDVPKGWIEKITRKASDIGGAIINNTERFDRAVSFIGARNMAAKQGMTAEQAAYSIYDTILKTNFMSGSQNPAWLRNPKIRAMLMFQGTPFKILEQRMLLASQAGKSFSNAAKETWKQLQGLRGEIKEGERLFKTELIKEALTHEKDVYGIPYSYQLMRQMMAIGTIIYGGKALFESDMTGHLLHVPFTKVEGGKIGLSTNPILDAAIRQTIGKKPEDDPDEFWLSGFMKKWMSSGPVPAAIVKGQRLSADDIPEIYRGSKFRYLFGVPAVKEEE